MSNGSYLENLLTKGIHPSTCCWFHNRCLFVVYRAACCLKRAARSKLFCYSDGQSCPKAKAWFSRNFTRRMLVPKVALPPVSRET